VEHNLSYFDRPSKSFPFASLIFEQIDIIIDDDQFKEKLWNRNLILWPGEKYISWT
jgi:hypothetical protein